MRYIFVFALLLSVCNLYGQENKPEKQVTVSTFTAQFMISTNMKAVFLNVAGAGLKYNRNNLSISLTIFPSLSFREDVPEPGEKKKPFVRPGFALGPLVQYKRFLFGCPNFYQDDAWHFTVGMGMKFGK